MLIGLWGHLDVSAKYVGSNVMAYIIHNTKTASSLMSGVYIMEYTDPIWNTSLNHKRSLKDASFIFKSSLVLSHESEVPLSNF